MITIKEIAKRAGVSIGTVDRVLHSRGRVAAGTAERIRAIVKQSGYKPNLIARSLSLKKQLLIAVLMPLPNQDGGYWKKPKAGVLNAGRELAPYNVKIKVFHYNKFSETSFRDRFREMFATRPDGIFMAPVISNTAEELIQDISLETAYLFFDANIKNSRNISFIGQNSYDSGVLAGELVKMIIQGSGAIAAIQPMKNDYHIRRRIEGFCHAMAQSQDHPVSVYIPEKEGEAVSFKRLIRQVLEETSQIKGLFVSNAACHYAADYLENNSRRDIKLIGYDLVKKNIRHLQNGVIDFLICQRPEKQGFDGIHILHRFLAFGEKSEKQIFMPLDIVTKMNLKYYQYV